ncbi:hypothetical protein K1719_000162 [Acacia pycnantha]|nr:hypothetical protein K1719_000162 [Acacia pycnantha]
MIIKEQLHSMELVFSRVPRSKIGESFFSSSMEIDSLRADGRCFLFLVILNLHRLLVAIQQRGRAPKRQKVIYRFLNECTKSDLLELSNVASRMKEKYDKYWGDSMKINKLLYIATVLDPGYKLDWVQFALCKMHTRAVGEHLGVHIKEVLISLYNEYNQVISPSAQPEMGPSNDTQDLLDDVDPSLKNLTFKKLHWRQLLTYSRYNANIFIGQGTYSNVYKAKDWPKRMQLISGTTHLLV